jgi:hypothetical protein
MFFAFAACSWVPHWSCHYYRLETGSSFVVGSWEFSRFDSGMSLLIYTGLILANIVCVVRIEPRRTVALVSGLLHVGIGSLHAYRLAAPFRFEVFGYNWSQQASLREAIIVIPFGILCLWMARQK